jgi:hypothetical protein
MKAILFALLLPLSSLATTIVWDPSPTPNVAYHVKWGMRSKQYTYSVDTYDKTFTFKFPKGKYYFAVTAFDTVSGVESVPTNEVIVTQ